MIFGLDVAEIVFSQLDPEVQIEREVQEGVWREQGGAVLTARGDAAALLSGERTALNFLAHLSGVATISAYTSLSSDPNLTLTGSSSISGLKVWTWPLVLSTLVILQENFGVFPPISEPGPAKSQITLSLK